MRQENKWKVGFKKGDCNAHDYILNFQMTWLFYSFLFYSAITDNEDLKTTASTRLKQLPEYNSAEPQ